MGTATSIPIKMETGDGIFSSIIKPALSSVLPTLVKFGVDKITQGNGIYDSPCCGAPLIGVGISHHGKHIHHHTVCHKCKTHHTIEHDGGKILELITHPHGHHLLKHHIGAHHMMHYGHGMGAGFWSNAWEKIKHFAKPIIQAHGPKLAEHLINIAEKKVVPKVLDFLKHKAEPYIGETRAHMLHHHGEHLVHKGLELAHHHLKGGDLYQDDDLLSSEITPGTAVDIAQAEKKGMGIEDIYEEEGMGIKHHKKGKKAMHIGGLTDQVFDLDGEGIRRHHHDNPWITFLMHHKGEGYSRHELSSMYHSKKNDSSHHGGFIY